MDYYPINEFGPAMKGMIIGSLGIFHVFLAQFAIGGGMLLCYFEWLGQTGRSKLARQFVDGYFKFLVLISFVLGAVTGVGMWFTTIQVSPGTIGLMVDEFHWFWATEFAFFALEVVTGYLFYRYGPSLPDRSRITLLVLYSFAAWASLFWINGILSWQLTPGGWNPEEHNIWAGFFNPSFFPSLIFRTVTSMTIAGLVACAVINFIGGLSRDERQDLITRAAIFLAPMVLMPVLGIWYFASISEESRSYVMGKSAAMTLFFTGAVGASMLIGAYALIGLLGRKMYANAATTALLIALAFAATGGGEFVREGIRKPFTVRGALYSNSIRPEDVPRLRETGSVTGDPYPLTGGQVYPNDQLRLGAKVYRFQCSACHTIEGANALVHLTSGWDLDQKRLMISKLQKTKPFMPPFAGTAEELESLVQLIAWYHAGQPDEWDDTTETADYQKIRDWLDEAGTEPAGEFVQHDP